MLDSTGSFKRVDGKRRVSNVKINGENLNVNKKYNASLIKYIANGGDGFTMFSKFEIINESEFTDTESLAYYIKKELKGEIPKKYKSLQNRIRVINGKNKNSNFKKSGRLSTGIIIGIIVSLAFILIIVIKLIIVRKLRRNNQKIDFSILNQHNGNIIRN